MLTLTHHRRTFAAHENHSVIRQKPAVTVGVTDRQGRYEAISLSNEGSAVTDVAFWQESVLTE